MDQAPDPLLRALGRLLYALTCQLNFYLIFIAIKRLGHSLASNRHAGDLDALTSFCLPHHSEGSNKAQDLAEMFNSIITQRTLPKQKSRLSPRNPMSSGQRTPRSTIRSIPYKTKSNPPRHPEKSIICVVDDELQYLKALVRLLRTAGFQIVPFENPRRFLKYAKHYPISLAIIDLRMPEVGGLDVQRALHDICPRAKVIIITGEQEPGVDKITAFDQGAIAFLFKPLCLSPLLEAIHTVYPVLSN